MCVTGKETCFANSVTGEKSHVNVIGEEFYTGNQDCFVTCKEDNLRTLTVNSCVVNHAHFVSGLPQKKGVIPNYCHLCREIKHVKGISCVGQSSYVQNVTNVPAVVPNLTVGARLHQFWKKWAALGVSPKSIDSPQGRLHPPLPVPAKFDEGTHSNKLLCKSHRNSYLLEALHQLLDKNAVELVLNQQSLGFYNRLFLVPKPNNWWRPILDLSKLNTFLKTQSFKMEKPETIRTSLQTGGVGDFHRFQGRLLPHTNKQSVHAYSQ